MAHELRAEQSANVSQRHIASVISPNGQCRTTNECLWRDFRDYFHQGVRNEQSSVRRLSRRFLLPRGDASDWAHNERCIKEDEDRQALKTVKTDETPEVDGLLIEMCLRMSPMFVPLLMAVCNNWMKQGTIPQRFTRGIVKFLRKNKYDVGGSFNDAGHYFGEDLGRLGLKTALPSQIAPERTCAVKRQTI